jgi:hypothetical protein
MRMDASRITHLSATALPAVNAGRAGIMCICLCVCMANPMQETF